jgi:serine protease AprX
MFRMFSGALIFLTGTLAAFGGHPKMARDLEQVDPTSTVDVIVQFKEVPTAQTHQRLLARSARHKLALSSIRSSVMSVHASDLSLLADSPDVEFVSPDRKVSAAAADNRYTGLLDYGWMTALNYSGPSAKLPAYDGSGIGIAIIDSGMDNMQDLKDAASNYRVVYWKSFASDPKGLPYEDGTDDYGHGTMVAGIAGGNGASSTGSMYNYQIRGIAPNVNFINLRVLDEYGSGQDSWVIAAIQHAIALKNTYNIRVINLSLGRPVYTACSQDPLCQAVKQAW